MTILAWLITTASLALFLNTLISSSIPITNMKRISPIWLRNFKLPKDSTETKQQKNQNTFPITKALKQYQQYFTYNSWLSNLLENPTKSRATRIIITICAKSIAKGHQNCVSWKI
jgi:hypothetical protein